MGSVCSSHADSTADAACLSALEVEQQVESFKVRLHSLLETIPTPLSIKYVSLKMQIPVSGYAYFTEKDGVSINISGTDCRGLLQQDELDLLMCHEVGHAMGGAPFMSFAGVKNIAPVSAEGQADFFATSSCLPQLWRHDDSFPYLNWINDNPDLGIVCPADGRLDRDRGLCIRIARASLNFSRFIHRAIGDEVTMPPKDPGPLPTLLGKDSAIAPFTLRREYPRPQCRLQTFIQGLLCQTMANDGNFSIDPLTPLACDVVAQDAPRPSCWFSNDDL